MFGLMPYERRGGGISFYNPFKELEELEKRFFSERVPGDFRTDIRDNGKEYILEADLPGFKKEDISIDVNSEYLTITASHSENKDEKDKEGNYLRRERSYGSFTRSFDVSEVEEENITASFKNGVLELKLPKKEAKGNVSRKIAIEN